jgi:hypothetical protein
MNSGHLRDRFASDPEPCIAVLVRGDGGWIEVRDRVWLEIK